MMLLTRNWKLPSVPARTLGRIGRTCRTCRQEQWWRVSTRNWRKPMRAKFLPSLIAAAAAIVCTTGIATAQQAKELTFWSHWAAEMPKRTFVEEAIRQLEAKNSGSAMNQ